MDLKECYNFLQFFINKAQGGFYPPEELDLITDKGQLRYYKNCFIKYGTGQRLTDALAPFKKNVAFTTDTNGFLTAPDDYMDLIDIIPMVDGKRVPCPVLNEDEITNRANSQVIPNSITAPFAEITAGWDFQLYPKVTQSGFISYFSRPQPPKFVYTTVSGRVIVYNQSASTQLLWSDDEIESLLLCSLESIGINLSENDILQWSDAKNNQNLMQTMKL